MPTTAIEVYVKEEISEVEDDLDLQALRLETDQNKLLAVQLGMKALALEDERIYQLARYEKMLGIRSLTEHEYQVWKWWLPTCYSSKGAEKQFHGIPSNPRRALTDYCYDRMPGRVRRLMLHFKKEQLVFDELMIWTPERQVIDPALFGRIEGAAAKQIGTWLLARWGESAENLISFEQIEKQFSDRGMGGFLNYMYQMQALAQQASAQLGLRPIGLHG